MFNNDAAMKRGAERQEFLQQIQRGIWEEETPRTLDSCLPLMTLLLKRFEKEEGVQVAETTKQRMEVLFETQIIPAVESFAKNPEERRKMLADLFKYLAESVTRQHQMAFNMKESEMFRE